MDRRNKVYYLYHLIGEELESILLEEENGMDQLTAEQVISLATQFVTTEQFNITNTAHGSPVGTINPNDVMFEMTDGSCVNLRGVYDDDES